MAGFLSESRPLPRWKGFLPSLLTQVFEGVGLDDLSGITVGGWLTVGSYGVESWDLRARTEGISSQPKALLLFTLTCANSLQTDKPHHSSSLSFKCMLLLQ